MSNYAIISALRDNDYTITMNHGGFTPGKTEHMLVKLQSNDGGRDLNVAVFVEGAPIVYEKDIDFPLGRESLKMKEIHMLESLQIAPPMSR